MKKILLIIIILILPIPANLQAAGLPLGARCKESHECGTNLGCRESSRGDFKVCKITVPGTLGCEQGAELENMCADTMICEQNRCKHTFGNQNLDFVVPVEEVSTNAWQLPDFFTIPSTVKASNLTKIIYLVLSLTFLIGITFIFRGVLAFKNAIGFIPAERSAWVRMGIGVALIVSSLFLWILLA